jgi:hypothetical protein
MEKCRRDMHQDQGKRRESQEGPSRLGNPVRDTERTASRRHHGLDRLCEPYREGDILLHHRWGSAGLAGSRSDRGVDARDRTDQLLFFAFDLLFLNGQSTAQPPLIERKERLKRLFKKKIQGLRYNEHVTGDGPRFRRAADNELKSLTRRWWD